VTRGTRGRRVYRLEPVRRRHGLFQAEPEALYVQLPGLNLKRVLAELKWEGVRVAPKVEASEYGRFGWIMDPEGNRIELWEPPK
jgi:predicted enzyme related to lactoylglutathione lyase